MWLIQKTLRLREKLPQLFAGDYQPAYARGERAENIFAFRRSGKILVVIPRFTMKLNHQWRGTKLDLPQGTWKHEFAGGEFAGEVYVEDLLKIFPVALLVGKDEN